MSDLIPTITRWQNQGKAVALATVVKVYGSAPRPLGSKMAVSAAAEMAGSVSGGCVESAVVQEALAVIGSGAAKRVGFGIADEWAQTAGLACGGNIEVFIQRLEAGGQPLIGDELVAQVTLLAGADAGRAQRIWPDGRTEGSLGSEELERLALAQALELLSAQRTERRPVVAAGVRHDVFFDIQAPPPHLIIVGAVHIAIPLVTFANTLGFRTTVLDARGVFATPDRFAHADQLILRWPADALNDLKLNESSYIAVLSHDDKLDVPALHVALRSQARYIGALGSRTTMSKRAASLRHLGLSDEQLARVHNPIGLDLGGRAPAEIALAIMAEIVAVQNGA